MFSAPFTQVKDFSLTYFVAENVFNLFLQHSEEMYDSEIYRHQIAEYYNPYVLDTDIQAGESYFNISFVSCV